MKTRFPRGLFDLQWVSSTNIIAYITIVHQIRPWLIKQKYCLVIIENIKFSQRFFLVLHNMAD